MAVGLTPSEFAAKWKGNERTERAASQEHFIDLCRMLGVPTPNEADPTGDWYAFEKGAEKLDGGDGFADVWKREHFAWEYKGKRKNLGEAYKQLLLYREALENPPCLVVCDMDRFQVHTNFTGTAKRVHEFTLADMVKEPETPLRVLRAVMSDPSSLRPTLTRNDITKQAAEEFAGLAKALRGRGHDAHRVAHFLNKVLFCLFAEDAGLLPAGLLERLATSMGKDPTAFTDGLRALFERMAKSGGSFGVERIEWFNGGLFDTDDVVPMTREDIAVVKSVSRLDWSEIEPAIFGTLFERGLDPENRTSLGAHYTDRDSIMRIIDPVILAPLRREFETLKTEVKALVEPGKRGGAATKARNKAAGLLQTYLDRLAGVRVLDPACGSGNFLYMALQALKDLEREALIWGSETLATTMGFPKVGPQVVRGIEKNDYAAELARVTIWIGEIQWMLAHGFAYRTNPILQPLESIECRDAILDLREASHPLEAEWPDAEFIIGNPPFLGSRMLRRSLGDSYVDALFTVWHGRVPREADLVTYWHEKARAMVEAGRVRRVGLLATQAIRGGASREILKRIKRSGGIFFAVSDQAWVLDGAAVHVSLVGFDDGSSTQPVLDGRAVASINSDLTTGVDLTSAAPLRVNMGIGFQGDKKVGPFDIDAEVAAAMLVATNPDGRKNSDVVRRWTNADLLLSRRDTRWIIDFNPELPLEEAARYEAPFEHVKREVFPARHKNRRAGRATRWWIHGDPQKAMRSAIRPLSRFAVTGATAKHRIFLFLPREFLPDAQLLVFAREDWPFLGILQSTVHERWSRRTGTQLREAETGFRYTPETCFEAFPFPAPAGGVSGEGEGKAATLRAVIAKTAENLVHLRDGWLNPKTPDGSPALQGKDLAGRTLTSLYNVRPTWLEDAHLALDRAVLAAYGWPEEWAEGLQPRRDESGEVNPALGTVDPAVEQEVLSRLLALNQEPPRERRA